VMLCGLLNRYVVLGKSGCNVFYQKRFYAIMDRYIFVKTPEQLQKEEEKNRKVELNRQKQILEKLRKQIQLESKYNFPTKEAPLNAMLFQYKTPVQPENPHYLEIAIVGAPNAGKSTLVNRFVGTKISAVSQKSHTTRSNTLGVVTMDSTQLSFVDTPGITHKFAYSATRSTRQLTLEAWKSVLGVDLVMVVVDAVKTITGDQNLTYIIESIAQLQKKHKEAPPAILVINKLDLYEKIPEKDRKPVVERFIKHFPEIPSIFYEIFTISALNGQKVLELQNWLIGQAKPKEWEYHQDTKTLRSDVELCEEIIREKIYKRINQEVPYMIRLENAGWTNLPTGGIRIDENVLVKKSGHKKLFMGKQGRGIYGIIETATQELQALLRRPVELQLHVKIDKANNEEFLD